MKYRIAFALSGTALILACATPYDPKQHQNLDELNRAPATLDDLLPQIEAPADASASSRPDRTGPTGDEASIQQETANSKKAIENYRAILALAPESREVKWEAQRRLADLQVEVSELDPDAQTKGVASAENSIDLYNSLLDARPDDPGNDRILYQLARAYQNTGQVELAIDSLAELTRNFPDTALWTDAQFRRAELLFNRRDYPPAEQAYREVMKKGRKTSYFEQAQYKYGWSIFKQDRYADSLDTFVAILDRELPVGAVENLDATLEVVPRAQRELVRDVLRVVSLSFSYLGGGEAITEFLKGKPERSFEPVFYENLARLFLEKGRFDDAARAYASLADRSPTHPLAPKFQARVIEVYDQAGFADLVLQAKIDYVEKYDLDQIYWTAHNREDSPQAYALLRENMDELARHWHASAQKADKPAARTELFRRATSTYARYLERFEDAGNRAEINFLLAEAHFQNQDFVAAATQFERTAWDYPAHDKSAEAGYAAVLARQALSEQADEASRPTRIRESVATSLRFAEGFADHPEQAKVLMRAAEDLYSIEAPDQAIAVAQRLTAQTTPAAQALHLPAWTLIAYAHMDQKRYADAEQGLSAALRLSPPEDPKLPELKENLATAIYRQGEAARTAQDLDAAIAHFLRVKTVLPGSELAAAGDFDAAAGLITQEKWPEAAQVLLQFRQAYPNHPLQAETTRKLAGVYLKDGKKQLAAGEFKRIARSPTEAAEARRAAAWQAAGLYDESGAMAEAEAAYGYFIATYDQPYSQILKAQERLIAITAQRGDRAANRRWLRQLIDREKVAGAQRSARSRTLAAQASLTLADDARRVFEARSLTAPLQRSLPIKKAAMDKAMVAYTAVAEYAIAEFTTQAISRIGELYVNFSQSLLKSERPRGLSELELEEYQFLLEDQAFPLEEKAIEIHASNTRRTLDGIYDDWVKASYTALAKLLPARYAKTERSEVTLETLD